MLNEKGVIGIIDVEGVPATAMLGMRETLRDQMVMTMAKKTLVRRAWKKAGMSEDELDTLFDGVKLPMLVQSNDLNAFQLFAELEKTKTGRAAKAGDIAPNEIIIEEGPTSFTPGPNLGEFNSVGIPAKIDKGKVAIQQTVTVVKEGEEISGDLGIMLAKLGINPIEIGLILIGTIEDGQIFPASSLDLDLDGMRDDIITATSGAFNLACNVRWFSAVTMPTLLSKASSEAMSVAVEAGVVNDETASLFIARANAHAMAIAGQLDSSALDESLVEALGAATSASAAAATSDAASEDEGGDAPAEEEEEEEGDAGFDGLGDLFG